MTARRLRSPRSETPRRLWQLREPAVEPFDGPVENVSQHGARYPAFPWPLPFLCLQQAAGGIVLHAVDPVAFEGIDAQDLKRVQRRHGDGREPRRGFVRQVLQPIRLFLNAQERRHGIGGHQSRVAPLPDAFFPSLQIDQNIVQDRFSKAEPSRSPQTDTENTPYIQGL